jgi:DNA gyrase inhibitor GyrI
MMTEEVRIERLAPMRVAHIAVKSEHPEGEALGAVVDWAEARGVQNYRLFGFDNCQPHPNHTYTAWLTVGADVQPDGEVGVKDFPGGLYAVTRVEGVEGISPGWKRLQAWRDRNGYNFGGQECLEEALSPLDTPADEIKLDLFLSIAE